ncbi:LCP family protein [Microbacterium sp. EYE_5]|uniref:LCP family protein n=1 Tax=unclassified Microbacterium TaxID=2609290 RepID=UPI0020067E51|nr:MULTISPECIES: LCP family protein [unclassified Microbacterium]MCK6079960.1 LCP family protein [Microbacterium sp. EYE_382]MCK6085231.1 LCP family protein [Microbacterium sp. EYE_384]MCK6122544.1 LCP family protein [Microbacterium sp. EYE_80]MCK6125994.1 LCP family protein [Microbacterium sp. EYE_79]MCK6140915.1 LCP family protein [Microbacterium sp. EYE_39]
MSARSDAKATKYRRQPVARHGALSSPSPIRQVLTILGAMLAVVVVSATAIGGFYVWDAARTLDESGVSIGDDGTLPPHIGEIEGGVNMLVVGTDSCEGQDLKLFPRCAHDDGGERNDVTMLVHISDEPRRVTVVSFPRDMIVPIPSCENPDGGSYPAMSAQMINVSYSYGGLGCSVATVEELTGIDIQFAAAIRWTGVINMSDAIGGVDVCVSSDISDRHTGLNLTAGNHNLVGAQALQFLRIRHGIGDGSDLGRISNQQQFMSSMVRKLQSGEVLSNYPTLLNLANTAIRQVNEKQLVLSESLTSPQRMAQIAMAVADVPYEDIVFVQYPTVYAPGGGRVLPVTSAADVLFTALQENKPVRVTGNPSGGNGVEVIGEAEDGAEKPTPTPTATADAGATPDAEPSPAPTGEAVDLPTEITGQSANQVTCTVAEQ